MEKSIFPLSVFGALLIGACVAQLYNNYQSWEPMTGLSPYFRIPNATTESKDAARLYLEAVTSPDGFQKDMEKLSQAVKTQPWVFANDDAALYVRGGVQNNPDAEAGEQHWNWSIPLGNIKKLATEAQSQIEELWESGNKELAESYLHTLTEVANRLLEGNPPLMQNLIGLSIGDIAIQSAAACPGIALNSKTGSALNDLQELATSRPGFYWEKNVAPHIYAAMHPKEFQKFTSYKKLPNWMWRMLSNRNIIQQGWANLVESPEEKLAYAQREFEKQSILHLAPLNFGILTFAFPAIIEQKEDHLRKEKIGELLASSNF